MLYGNDSMLLILFCIYNKVLSKFNLEKCFTK